MCVCVSEEGTQDWKMDFEILTALEIIISWPEITNNNTTCATKFQS